MVVPHYAREQPQGNGNDGSASCTRTSIGIVEYCKLCGIVRGSNHPLVRCEMKNGHI